MASSCAVGCDPVPAGAPDRRTSEVTNGKSRLFFSWNSKNPKNLILQRLVRRACEELGDMEYDAGTAGKSGSPSITDTILAKIRDADVVVCDVTEITQCGDEDLPNPNVLFEYGYANAFLDVEQIILLYTKHGHDPKFPFDIRGYRYSRLDLRKPDDTTVSTLKGYIDLARKNGRDGRVERCKRDLMAWLDDISTIFPMTGGEAAVKKLFDRSESKEFRIDITPDWTLPKIRLIKQNYSKVVTVDILNENVIYNGSKVCTVVVYLTK